MMSVMRHKILSAWDTKIRETKVKISLSDKYSEERWLLSSFLTQIETYIQFNREIFNSEAEKIMFTAVHLQSDTLN